MYKIFNDNFNVRSSLSSPHSLTARVTYRVVDFLIQLKFASLSYSTDCLLCSLFIIHKTKLHVSSQMTPNYYNTHRSPTFGKEDDTSKCIVDYYYANTTLHRYLLNLDHQVQVFVLSDSTKIIKLTIR